MDIGAKIRELRSEHGMSQEQFANQFAVTRQTVSNWENGKNYPDLSILIQISDAYKITLDVLLKNDMDYIHGVDISKKKANRRKTIILVLLLMLCGLMALCAYVLTHTYVPMDNGQRILSETDVRMLVNLPGATPSRAITRTFDADAFERMSERERRNWELEVLGQMEGDIPAAFMAEHPAIQLIFQDESEYSNEKIEENAKITSRIYNLDTEETTEKQVAGTYKDGGIYFDLEPDFVVFHEDLDDWYHCLLTVEYTIKGKDYISLTAVSIFQDRL